MSRNEPEEPWASALRRANLVDPRFGKPSWSALARAVGRHPSTITAMVKGERKTEYEAIKAVAEALRMDPQEVVNWISLESAPDLPPTYTDIDEQWKGQVQNALWSALENLGAVVEYPESVAQATSHLLGEFSDNEILIEVERRFNRSAEAASRVESQVHALHPEPSAESLELERAARKDSAASRAANKQRQQRDSIGEESQDVDSSDWSGA